MTPYTHADFVKDRHNNWHINLYNPLTQKDSWLDVTPYNNLADAVRYVSAKYPEVQNYGYQYGTTFKHTTHKIPPGSEIKLDVYELLKLANQYFPLNRDNQFKGRHQLVWDEETEGVVLRLWTPIKDTYRIHEVKLKEEHSWISAQQLLEKIKESMELLSLY